MDCTIATSFEAESVVRHYPEELSNHIRKYFTLNGVSVKMESSSKLEGERKTSEYITKEKKAHAR